MLEDARPPLNELPAAPGVGYKNMHFREILESPGDVAWLEIHAENYMGSGGRPRAQILKLREQFPFSCHGVGLSIGGEEDLDTEHLARLKALIAWMEPESFSEHLAWSTHEGYYFNDLLPLPYTEDTLSRVCLHVEQTQEWVGRRMLLENPSNYFEFEESTIDEIDFLTEIAAKSGCGLLLDVNNVFVSSTNRRTDPIDYLDRFPMHLVGEIHLGGHAEDDDPDGDTLLIDDHASEVSDPVWGLYAHAMNRSGPLPTLVEWDNDVPDWSTLSAEASRAAAILSRVDPDN